MGRKTIKMEPGREGYENGAFLERDERFETDAEWHGRVLDDIEFALSNTLPSIQEETAETVKSLDNIANRLWEISAILTSPPKTSFEPMAGWKFIFNWIMVLLILFTLVVLFKGP